MISSEDEDSGDSNSDFDVDYENNYGPNEIARVRGASTPVIVDDVSNAINNEDYGSLSENEDESLPTLEEPNRLNDDVMENRMAGHTSEDDESIQDIVVSDDSGDEIVQNVEGQNQDQVSRGPVQGFRVRVGPDGEEQLEFASDSDDLLEEESSDEDPSWNEQMGVEAAVEFALPVNIIAGVAQRVNQRRASVSAMQRIRGWEEMIQPETQGSSVQQRTPRSPVPRVPAGIRRPRKATKKRRRKGSKKKSPPKRKVPSKPKPPKPLSPLFISEDWNGNDIYKDCIKKTSKLLQYRLHINFKDQDQNVQENSSADLPSEDTATGSLVGGEVDTDKYETTLSNPVSTPQAKDSKTGTSVEGYKIGQVQFNRCGLSPWNWENKSKLLEAQPDIFELHLYVSPNPSSSMLHMKTRRVLSQQEAMDERIGPPPKLTKKDSQRELLFVVTQHYFYYLDPVGVPYDLLNIRGLGNRKVFTLDFNRFDMDQQCFILDVILLETAILGEHNLQEIPVLKFTAIQDVFTNFLDITPPLPYDESEAHQKEDIAWFYGQIQKYHKAEELPPPDISLQPAALKPSLREYQRDAVHWMLYREGALDHCIAHSSSAHLNRVDLIRAFQDKMYIPIKLTKFIPGGSSEIYESKDAFYNPYTAYVCWAKPEIPSLPSGGILCDEMGLGKTVETLSLILLNEKPIPDDLKDFIEGKIPNDVEEEDAIFDDSPNSWEDVQSNSSENSDDSDESSGSHSRKRRKRSRGRQRKQKPTTSSKPTQKSERKLGPVCPMRTTTTRSKRQRRAASPCEYTAAAEDGELIKDTSENLERNTEPSRPLTVIDAIEQKLKTSSPRKDAKGNSSQKSDKPPSTYDALKVLYDSALNNYKYAEMAKCMPKFHGKFYEVELELRECFECICGNSDDGYRNDEIVKCSVCGSSQHADCVGFDKSLKSFFAKIGKSYLCPHCESLEQPFNTKSTLIITPPSISHQWIKEIQRHVQNHRLNILFYKGVSTHGYLPPAKLARYDLVITTYNVLSTELDYVDLPHCSSIDGRRFRNPKRFLTIPSPLPSVLWWRVCLDEAQMVEGIGTKMSMMAMRFQAVHRWCVTGTPVNKGLQDLFGLFVFLQVSPINYDIWWNALVRDAFFRKETSLLFELFGQLIWRNGKQDVLDQLGIPPQTEKVHWLNFSPVETHFYKQQFEMCSNRILEKINRLQRSTPELDVMSAKLSSLDRFNLHGLLAPFLELRQACCHPQVVKGQLISLQKGTLTMEELLDRLEKKTQMHCHEDHRLMVAALNGMAGLYIIMDKWQDAAGKYREVLQSTEKHKEHFATDSLQLLHTVENLAEIIDGNHPGVPYTLRDGNLRSDAVVLREKYMKRYADAVKSAQSAVTPLTQSVDELRGQFTMHKQSWWVATIKRGQRLQKEDALVQTLKQDLMDVTKQKVKNSNSLANKFHDAFALERALVKNIMEMEQLRNTVLEGLEELQTNDAAVFVDSAIRCHLRQTSNSYYNDSQLDGKCKLCSYHDNFLFYESVIFKANMKDKISRTGRNYQQRKVLGELADELTDQTRVEFLQQEAEDLKATTEHVQLINEELHRGTWGDSETEVILKGLLRFARVNKLESDVTEDGNVHMKLLDVIKKEFRFMRILWRQIYDQVSALDELSQATTRLIAVQGDAQCEQQPTTSKKIKQLSSGISERTLKIQNIHVINRIEVDMRMNLLLSDFATGNESLAIHLGQLLYLKTLKRNGYGKKGTVNTEDCPICSTQLGKEWSVLRCGHSYCSECVKKMCPNALQSFLCPLCRHSMKFADVSFVDTTENNVDGTDAEPGTSSAQKEIKKVKGSHSTKVEAIIETLLRLQDTHPGEKCIIFSMWNDVLDIVAKALTENDIKYSLLNQPGKSFRNNLDRFKEREDLQVLLMPLTSGAKGLNIIEATHVLLVEPILNLASELQAIGRVHRIGQMKPTFVHRFYVKRTIEEKLFQIMKAQDVSSDEEGSLTVKDLQNLLSAGSK